MKILLGTLLGIYIILVIMFLYPRFTLSKTDESLVDSSGTNINLEQFLKEKGNYEEKIASVNKRFDDLFVLGGILVTVLLAINIGAYLKAEADVERLFQKNFSSYIDKVKDDSKAITQVKTEIETMFSMLKDRERKNKREQKIKG